MRAEHAPEERLVAPNLWATLSVHVVASPASHAALEVAGLSVHSFHGVYVNMGPLSTRTDIFPRKCPKTLLDARQHVPHQHAIWDDVEHLQVGWRKPLRCTGEYPSVRAYARATYTRYISWFSSRSRSIA